MAEGLTSTAPELGAEHTRGFPKHMLSVIRLAQALVASYALGPGGCKEASQGTSFGAGAS